MSDAYQTAAALDAAGLNVLPAGYKQKAPTVAWRQWQDRRTSEQLAVWFARGRYNYWVMTGAISGVCVLDCDTAAAEAWWHERIGDLMERTACVKTAKGHHYWFRLQGPMASWAQHDIENPDGIHFDVRADGTGVIVPPSIHESGTPYEWIRDLSHLLDIPEDLRKPTGSHGDTSPGTSMRSGLAHLLEHPAGVGGRNQWMAQVAGHYAVLHRSFRDAYEIHCRQANDLLAEPLTPAELDKTVESIWRTEQTKTDALFGMSSFNEENGWLYDSGERILCMARFKQQEEWVHEPRTWANASIKVLGVMETEGRAYDVAVAQNGTVRTELLTAGTIADSRQLSRWFAELGIQTQTPARPERMIGADMSRGERLQRFLDHQKAPYFQVVNELGWHDGIGYVCHEGVINKNGIADFAGVRPHPRLRNRAPYHYGFVDENEAVRVLREVLSFHYQNEAAVFGAWWAACLIKPQLAQVVSQFPFMALEAPSESGKTTGMFALLIQLAGNQQGQTIYTAAAMRDALASHNNAPIWLDDEDTLEHLHKLLRVATAEGSFAKKGEDNTSQEAVQLVAPIAVSGEALGLSDQKALIDRSISLEAHNPTGRRSNHGDYPQWDDILELRRQYPNGLSALAGNMVQIALRHVDITVAELVQLRGTDPGRRGDRIGVLRAGARLLSRMTGDRTWADYVEDWVANQDDSPDENSLTLKILPAALAIIGKHPAPEPADRGWPITPVLWRTNRDSYPGLWFNVNALARWWEQRQHGRIQVRTESLNALQQQVRAFGWTERHRFMVGRDVNSKPQYTRVPDDIAALIYARADDEQVLVQPTLEPGHG